MSKFYLKPIDRIKSGATTPGPRNNDNEGVLYIPQIYKARALTIRLFNLLSRTLVVGSGVLQLVYSTAPADWALCI